jgi:microfibrillar-associated protein 1
VVVKGGKAPSSRRKVVGDDSSSSDDDSSDEEEDEAAKRRARIKAKMINREKEEEKKVEEKREEEKKKKEEEEEEEEESDESGSEEESGSDESSSEEVRFVYNQSEDSLEGNVADVCWGRNVFTNPCSTTSQPLTHTNLRYPPPQSESDEEIPMPKIAFVPKSKRGTIAAAEKAHEDSEQSKKKKEKEKELKALETQMAVVEVLRKEREGNEQDVSEDQNDLAGIPDVDEDDDNFPDEDSEGYRMWEDREIMRLVEEALEKSREKNKQALKEEKKRMAKMTDEERIKEDETLLESAKRPSREGGGKGGPKFLQRYQHKGAFYMDSDKMDADDVRLKNYHLQASGDLANVDVKNLPKVMQVRNFGRKGQSKYTHMKDQDTTGESLAYGGMGKGKKRERDGGEEGRDAKR